MITSHQLFKHITNKIPLFLFLFMFLGMGLWRGVFAAWDSVLSPRMGHADLTLSPSSPTESLSWLHVEKWVTMKAVARFRAPSHGQYLSIFIPSSLRLSNFLIVPQQAGGSGWNEGPVQIQENVTEQGVPGKRYLVKVKDGNYGAISLQFQVAFQRDISFYGKRAKIHAGLGYGNVTAGQLTTSQSVELSAGIRTELFRSFSKNPTVISPGIPIEYKFEFTSHFYFPYTSTQPKVSDTESTMFYNFKGVIPIPERVVSVKTKESYVHYNQSSHQIEVDLGDFRGRRKPVTFEVIYPQVASGTLFQAGEIIFRGKEGKESAPQDQAPLRTFVFSGISETLQAPMVKFQGAAYSPQRKNTLIIDEKDQYLLSFAIKNEGSVPLHNLKIRPMFPSEWRVRGLTLPAPEGYHPEFKLFFESQIHLSGTTNTQRVIHKTFSPQAQIVTPELLGLGEHEYLKEASLTFDHFNPRDWLSETSFIQRTFGFIGDVLKEDKEHQLLTEGQRIHVDTYFSADEFLERRHQASITYTNSSLISWDLVNSAYKEGKRLNKAVGVLQWDELAMRINAKPYARPNRYFYSPGHQNKDFYFLLKIPKGFKLKENSIKVRGIPHSSIGSPKRIFPQKVTDYTIWWIPIHVPYTFKRGTSYQGEQVAWFSFMIDYVLTVDRDCEPKTYDFSQVAALSADHDKYELVGRFARYFEDNLGIFPSSVKRKMVYTEPWPYALQEVNVAANDFWLDTCLKTHKDIFCKKLFDIEAPASVSNYISEGEGTHTITLYNYSAQPINALSYTLSLPRKGSFSEGGNINEWEPKLLMVPRIEGTENVAISYDGNPHFSPEAKQIQFSIPTIAPHSSAKIIVMLKAPVFEEIDEYSRTFLGHHYRFEGDTKDYNLGIIGLQAVPGNFDPNTNPAYAFCDFQEVKNANPVIGTRACKALLELYRNTRGENWSQASWWRVAFDPNGKKEDLLKVKNICDWYGITCKNKRLVKLDLSGNGLKGSLPLSIKHLSDLQELILPNNQLSHSLGAIKIRPLQVLNLANNPLYEKLPERFFDPHRELLKVDLSSTHLYGKLPPSLAVLSKLQTFNVANNFLIEELPKSLQNAHFGRLKSFVLSGNYIEGLHTSPSYLHLIDRYRSAIDHSSPQNKISLLDQKGNAVENLEYLRPNSQVTISLIKEIWDGKRFVRSADKLDPDDFELKLTNVKVLNAKFPHYVIQLQNGIDSGELEIRLKALGATQGKRTSAKVKLSLGKLIEEKQKEQWSGFVADASQKFGTGLHFELGGKYLDEYFSMVHFNVGGNDFWGGFFWLPVRKLDTPVMIKTERKDGSFDIKSCSNQVRGFYYNSQRGERLRPLDQESQTALRSFSQDTYGNLMTQWGFYTSCIGDIRDSSGNPYPEDPYGVYGMITHTYGGKNYTLNAGVAYNALKNTMKADGLRCNFQRLNNSYPFGYIYDENGHIGFVGAAIKADHIDTLKVKEFHEGLISRLDEGHCIDQIFSYDGNEVGYTSDPNKQIPGFGDASLIWDFLDFAIGSAKTTLFKLGIKGIVGLTRDLNLEDKQFFEGNTLDSTLLVNTDATLSKMINLANKNAEKLCRGKWQKWNLKMNSPIICINKETIINGSLSAKDLAGKTLIVKNTDLQLNPDQKAEDQPLHLFIDQGNLFLPSSIATGDLQSFDAFGYLKTPAPSEEKSLAKAQFLKGNIIINGLLLGGDEDTPQPISNKLYIHGKFSSFNTLKQATPERIAMLRNLFPGPNSWEQYISFDTLFDWKCLSGKGSDGTRCKGVSKKEAQQLGKKSELLVDKAFGLIDMDFSNPLFR